MSFLELDYFRDGESIVGIDEVGRGPIAGPVVACAVQFTGAKEKFVEHLEFLRSLKVTDSKKLNQKKRILILNKVLDGSPLDLSHYKYLKEYFFADKLEGFSFTLQEKCPEEIEALNILWASMEAMGDCAQAIWKKEKTTILIDGNRLPRNLPVVRKSEAIIKGDEKAIVIGLASIIAKEFRDQLMAELDCIYPEFKFVKNSGYPTPAHKEALMIFGKTPIHRNSFKTVQHISKKYGEK